MVGLLFVPVLKARLGCLARSDDLFPVVIQICTVSPAAAIAALGASAGCSGSGPAQFARPASVATKRATAEPACMLTLRGRRGGMVATLKCRGEGASVA